MADDNNFFKSRINSTTVTYILHVLLMKLLLTINETNCGSADNTFYPCYLSFYPLL